MNSTAAESGSAPCCPMNRKVKFGLWALLAVVLVLAGLLVNRFTRNVPVDYDDIGEHFKYGSIGSETSSGMPYWIWKVIPELFPEHFPGPGGYASFGFMYEPGKDLPIGVSRRVSEGLDRVWLNCAVCHTGTVRESPDAAKQLYVGMPANNFRLYEFIQFIRGVALDNRLNPDQVMAKIDAMGGNLDFIDRLLYRYLVIDRVRESLFGLRKQLAFLDRQHDWGPGRVDTFNPYKAAQFNFPMDKLPQEELIGPADYPSIWNQGPREGMYLHWDGNNPSVEERNKSASLGAGVTPVTLDRERLGRIEKWLVEFKAPPYPKPVDAKRAEEGRKLYDEYCAACHGTVAEGKFDFETKQYAYKYDFDRQKFPYLGTVDPIEHVKTDPGRLNSYSEALSANQNTLYTGFPWRFKSFRKTHGYANMPLDGIWLRSPYLHNGSVPTLRDLLEPSAKRPKVFYRGYDVFDWTKVGFISDLAEEKGHAFFRYDTAVEGNSNAGHEGPDYGTHLSDAEKDAIVEFMKSF